MDQCFEGADDQFISFCNVKVEKLIVTPWAKTRYRVLISRDRGSIVVEFKNSCAIYIWKVEGSGRLTMTVNCIKGVGELTEHTSLWSAGAENNVV